MPLDWDHPNGSTIHLALIRHLASKPKQRIGTMFFNPGGPGTSGVDTVRGTAADLDAFNVEPVRGPRRHRRAAGAGSRGRARRSGGESRAEPAATLPQRGARPRSSAETAATAALRDRDRLALPSGSTWRGARRSRARGGTGRRSPRGHADAPTRKAAGTEKPSSWCHGWYHKPSRAWVGTSQRSRKPASEAGFRIVGATGFAAATFRPQPSGSWCRCVPGASPASRSSTRVDDLDA